jgi:hypothetical protein
MASTYSNLKIQLMATGENSGTWGNVTNVNLGTAIEEAIVGSEDVTFSSADVTLTLTDTNATQVARNLRLNLIGVSGGARQLIVPAIEKVYIVNNGLADAVTVRPTGGGTGIAVPNGKTMYLYNNGTDIVDAITHLTSLTLGTPLAVAQGGTGNNTGVNLETSLVIGVLPTSKGGTGSNTGVNVETALVTGVLPVTKGGTGLATMTAESVLIGDGTNQVKLIAPGTAGNVLVSTGTAWSSGAGGKVLQVVSTTKTDQFSSNYGLTPTAVSGLSVSITPTKTSSKILVIAAVQGAANATDRSFLYLYKNGSPAIVGDAAGSRIRCYTNFSNNDEGIMKNHIVSYLDSPNTTSAITYQIYLSGQSSSSGKINSSYADNNSDDRGRGVSTITAMEIA